MIAGLPCELMRELKDSLNKGDEVEIADIIRDILAFGAASPQTQKAVGHLSTPDMITQIRVSGIGPADSKDEHLAAIARAIQKHADKSVLDGADISVIARIIFWPVRDFAINGPQLSDRESRT
ncbi:hypothetical protein Pan44_35270 [Caulifigura coniformis]|uniref:Uncharacterized protein n=1 Tax=Caulifigura coniformis TaxID=2527983 RepID=A0A517SH79_9PLAN|nr:hypothetical protein [Caulifigura coniformis]QDT55483.1 hypothetical protein Pan44_35270 [Caulifigura coniformis]